MTVESHSSSRNRIHRAALRLFAERGTQEINVSELAHYAGVARGTIYNNLPNPERLFEDIAAELSAEMNQRIVLGYQDLDSSAERLARGIRMYIRRAHNEPDWGRFIARFAFSTMALRTMWADSPINDIQQGIQNGEFKIDHSFLYSLLGMIAGSVLSAILMVLEGHKTWRDSGSETATLVLRAMGVDEDRIAPMAYCELPPLPELLSIEENRS